jgi:DNA repair protein RecO (recombination protein O)
MSANQIVTKAVVLTRTDFQEADRIITVLTPDQGKLRLIAKGVRRSRSKMAGGIELFSVSDITYLPGKKEIGTLVSSRLVIHFADIVKDINRTMLGYEFLKRLNRLTEDAAGEEYFNLIMAALSGLDNADLSIELIELWFTMQLLKVSGHSPNLRKDTAGEQLQPDQQYLFDYENMAFTTLKNGPFSSNHIKLLRLAIGTAKPEMLVQIQNTEMLARDVLTLAKSMLQRYVRV